MSHVDTVAKLESESLENICLSYSRDGDKYKVRACPKVDSNGNMKQSWFSSLLIN